jgi:hypothetical protein
MKTRRFNRGLVCTLLTTVLLGWLFCGPAAAEDAALMAIPADSIFCVRLNNFDYTLSQFDAFMTGVSPMGVSMMARMQLANMLGDPMLQGINTAGSFVIFGKAEAKQTSDAKPEILIVALLPAKDYQQFINLSQNVGEPDAEGVSKISIPPMMGMPADPNAPPPPPAKVLLCTKVGQFAMVGPDNKRSELIELAKSISTGQNSMAKKVDADQAKLSAEMPLWAYADIELVNKTFAAEIEKAFAKMESEIESNPAAVGQMPMENFGEIMKVYLDIIKSFMEQGKYASIAVKPEPSVLRIKETLAAKAGTDMAELLTADASLPKENKLVAQLEDGSAITAAAKVNKAWMEKLSEIGMSFMAAASTKDANMADEMAKMKQISKDKVDSMGQLLAFSLKGNPGTKPPFAVEHIVEIKDKEKFDKILDESSELMKTGAFAQMRKSTGIEISFDIQRGTDQYNGVKIDSARFTMKCTDANSQEAQMIQTMFGGGFDYRFAYLDGLNLMTVGGDVEANIRKMIDSVKAGANKQPGAEIAAAMALLGDTKDADFFGTLNIIRLMALGMGFVPTPMPMPFDQIPTKSNIAFAGKVGDGKLTADVAIPKEHITELSMGMQMMMQQQMQQGGQTGPAQ